MTVLSTRTDANASERGKLSGTVARGILSFNPDGTLSGASSVELTVEGGAGEYAGVSGGSASINLSSEAENPSKLSGTFVLTF